MKIRHWDIEPDAASRAGRKPRGATTCLRASTAMASKRPPEGGLALKEEGAPSNIDLDGKVGAYPIRLSGLQPLGLKFRESRIGTK